MDYSCSLHRPLHGLPLKANSAALEQVHDSLMEASRSCGATMWQSLKDIVIPLVKPGMISAFFLIFLPALRELTVSIMLYAPTTRTIGVAIYTLNEDGENGYVYSPRRYRPDPDCSRSDAD